MEIFRAARLPGRARAASWNELYSSRVERADFQPADVEDFDAELRLASLGPLRIARLSCGRSTVDRTPRHIRPGCPSSYSFILQTQGSGVFSHYGHENVLRQGDLTLCDSAAPHSWRVAERSEVVMLRVPAALLKEYLPSPGFYCGRHLPAARGLTTAVASLALGLCGAAPALLSGPLQDRVVRHLLELIATSYAMAFEAAPAASSVISGRHAKVRLYIEQHLRDPALSPCAVARELRLSSRYLRMIFATSRETVSAYILRRRLEECARQIADTRWRGHSISEIAFAWGFNSASHFTRSFRERYGASPRDYRRRHAGGESDALAAPAA